MICSKTLADEAHSVDSSGKEFVYDHAFRSEVVKLKEQTRTQC